MRNTWLALLFLFLAVILPAGAVLWFMSDAARSQAESARRSVLEVYQGQLRFLRDRVDEAWNAVDGGMADAVLVLNADGSLRSPAPLPELKADATEDRREWVAARAQETQRAWGSAALSYSRIAAVEKDPSIAARAVQGQIRNLVRAGQREQAVALILATFRAGPGAARVDPQGRSIAADELLLAVRLLAAQDRRRATALQRLTAILNDYQGHPMPGAQRLFLMREAANVGGGPFPTFELEKLAAEFLEIDRPQMTGGGLQASALPGVWKLAAGRSILLFRTATVARTIQEVLDEYPTSGVVFAAIPPGSSANGDAVPAGAMLPGWQLSFAVSDAKLMEEVGRKRQSAYLLTGYLVIAAMIAAGLLAGRALRRQMHLARLKTDLVAAVSHEMKTPSASIRLLVDSLMEDRELDPRKTKEYLALISSENLRLTRLIENFLTFSRIERNRQRFDFSVAEPANIIQEAVAAVRERFQQADCDLSVIVEANLPPIKADAGALVSVLTNLLENAYKYTPGERHIEVRASEERGRVVFSVRDNGIGIPAREQKRIFRKFYQVDSKLSRETGGCGLGLSIVDHVVRAHGGSVTVQSRPREGSKFSVSLPASREARDSGETAAA